MSLRSILYLPDDIFKVCYQQLESVNYTEGLHRRTRGISFLSQVFGDGDEILKIENTLAAAIKNFNENFRREETFNGQVQHSIKLMDSEIFDIVKNEEQLQSKLTELHLDLQSYQMNRDYIVVKSTRVPEFLL